MTRLLFLPDDLTVVQVEVEITARQLVAAINSGLRPLPLLRDAPFGKLVANLLGNTVVVAPAVKRGRPPRNTPMKATAHTASTPGARIEIHRVYHRRNRRNPRHLTPFCKLSHGSAAGKAETGCGFVDPEPHGGAENY